MQERKTRSLISNNNIRIIHVTLATIALVAAGYELANCYLNNTFPFVNTMGIVIGFIVGGWLLYALLSINRLTRKKGLDPDKNRELIDVQLREEYKDFHFHLRETELLCIRLWTTEKPGKEIRVYFDDRDILVNIKTYLRYGHIESPYHVLANQQESKELLRRFDERTRNVA